MEAYGGQLNTAPAGGALQIASRFVTSAQKVTPLHLEGNQGATGGGAQAHFTVGSS